MECGKDCSNKHKDRWVMKSEDMKFHMTPDLEVMQEHVSQLAQNVIDNLNKYETHWILDALMTMAPDKELINLKERCERELKSRET